MVFPTKNKAKISSRRSYSVGAELISAELSGVPQSEALQIAFHDKYETLENRGEPYAIFTVSYSGERDYDAGWSITVRPVPRSAKHAVKEILTVEMFPRIRDWLPRHANLHSRYGCHSMRVIFDERAVTLLLEEHQTGGEAISN
jgi:hypothetical protein